MVDVGLDAGQCATEIELCVAVVAIVRLGREPTIKVVTIALARSNTPLPTVSFVKNPRALEANF